MSALRRLCAALGAAGLVGVVRPPAEAQAADDVSGWCSALQAATVQIRGDFLLYRGPETTRLEDWRAGSGFWVADGVVVTAHHVVDKMDRIEVCAPDGACREVTGVVGYPDTDVAVLQVEGTAPRAVRIAASAPIGGAVVAAGYPGEVGFVCGPGHVTGQLPAPSPFLLWEGAVAAEGSSGGPVALLGKNPKKLEVVGLVSGATRVGSVWFNRAAPLDVVAAGLAAARAPAAWREAVPWAEERPADVKLAAGRAWWEDLEVPAFQDLELSAQGGLCYGFYRALPGLSQALAPEPIAWTCDGAPLRYTTSADETVRIGLWTREAGGWSGKVSLRLR